MESCSPHAVFSSIDTGGRYAHGNQPMIARWNLARFAETLLSLIDDTAPDHAVVEATDVINGFIPRHEALCLPGARAKLGLTIGPADGDGDSLLAQDWSNTPSISRSAGGGWPTPQKAIRSYWKPYFPSADAPPTLARAMASSPRPGTNIGDGGGNARSKPDLYLPQPPRGRSSSRSF
jgi:hypothetical protein